MHSFIEKTAEYRNSCRMLTFLASVACAGMNEWSTLVLSTCLAGHQVTDEGARRQSQQMTLCVCSAVALDPSCSEGRSNRSSLAASAWLRAHTQMRRECWLFSLLICSSNSDKVRLYHPWSRSPLFVLFSHSCRKPQLKIKSAAGDYCTKIF